MKKKFVVIIVAFTLLITLLCGCSQNSSESGVPNLDIPDGITVSQLSVSWHKSYETIDELVSDSDFIGLIEITGIKRVENDGTLYSTVFTADVLEVVYSSSNVKSIDIYQTGRRTNTELQQIKDDPLMKIGDKWFIFARENDRDAYTILGPYGRFAYGGKDKPYTWLLEMVYPDYEFSEELAENMSFNTLKSETMAVIEKKEAVK